MHDKIIKFLTIIILFGILVGVAKKMSNEFFGNNGNYEYTEYIKDLEAQKQILLYGIGGSRNGGRNSNTNS